MLRNVCVCVCTERLELNGVWWKITENIHAIFSVHCTLKWFQVKNENETENERKISESAAYQYRNVVHIIWNVSGFESTHSTVFQSAAGHSSKSSLGSISMLFADLPFRCSYSVSSKSHKTLPPLSLIPRAHCAPH